MITRWLKIGKRGRKNRYESDVKPYLEEIKEWCSVCTEKQIAEKLGIGYSTFNRYKKEFRELWEALKKGRQNVVQDLRSALLKRAKGYEYIESKTVTQRTELPEKMQNALLEAGFTKSEISAATIVKTELYNKSMPPDVAAINLALKNYDPDHWANDPQMLKLHKQELALKKKKLESEDW